MTQAAQDSIEVDNVAEMVEQIIDYYKARIQQILGLAGVTTVALVTAREFINLEKEFV